MTSQKGVLDVVLLVKCKLCMLIAHTMPTRAPPGQANTGVQDVVPPRFLVF